ncbi:MAG: SDR family NAD(P)-dependent oxidoreductase [Rhodospirillales bacterium]|jgi:NADP-dependent 3-hydroxy acid dehydrogenase YdfG|nr:SDR family NAD(P)-dependent oxidoreductase [Rhodospirillales bacterium]
MKELRGKGVFITGAASGIGRGMARAFASAGMKLALGDLEAGPLAEVEAELRDGGADVHALELDVTDRAAVMEAGAWAESQLGKIHLLCNNAGVGSGATPLQDEGPNNWDWILSVNWGVRSIRF